MGGNEIIKAERAPRKPKADKLELIEAEPDAPAPTPKQKSKEAEDAGEYELLYLGQKNPKRIEIEHENGETHEVVFTKTGLREPGRASISCEDCYVHLMNIGGPSPDVPEQNIIFMPPSQLKPYLAAKSKRDKAREEALQQLKQPWRAEQAKKAARGE